MTPEASRDQRITVSILGYHYPVKHCSSCKAPIFWALNDTTSKYIPIDVLPDPHGLFVADRQGVGARGPIPIMRHTNDTAAGNRWTIHFATCPNAIAHRKPKKPIQGEL